MLSKVKYILIGVALIGCGSVFADQSEVEKSKANGLEFRYQLPGEVELVAGFDGDRRNDAEKIADEINAIAREEVSIRSEHGIDLERSFKKFLKVN